MTVARVLLAASLALTAAGAPAAAWTFDWVGRVELDARDLGADDPRIRLAAVTKLAGYDPALAAPHLLRVLGDPDLQVRLEAARALGRGAVAAAGPTMIAWLADIDAPTRAVAAEVLGELGGADATGALIRSLGDDDAGVRLRAVGALGQIGVRGDRQVVVPLVSRLEDDKAEVRRKAVEQLEALGDRRAVIPLVAAFGDTSLEVRKAAVRAVGALGDPAATAALVRLLRDPADEIRTAAVGALGAIGSPEAADTLIELLDGGPDLYRAKVAFALGQIAARQGATAAARSLRVLVAQLGSPSQRAAAREALTAAGPAAAPALVDHLEGRATGDPGIAVALLATSAVGDPRATRALVAELERTRVPVIQVVAALGATADPAALLPLLGLLEAPDGAVRLAAMNAVRHLIAGDPRAADVLVDRLADPELEVRILAAEYLGLIHAGRAVPRLVELSAAGTPPRLRLAAIDALGEIADPRAGRALVAVLRVGPPELQRAAADALSYLDDAATLTALRDVVAGADAGPAGDAPGGRHHAVRALAAMARGRGDAAAERTLRELIGSGDGAVAVAAIGGLAAAGSAASAGVLIELAAGASVERRRAAARALGELGLVEGVPVLTTALAGHDDRVSADAAWALGELAATGAAGAAAVRADDRVDILLRLARRGGWASAVNATAALARLAAADPAPVARLRGEALGLIHHRSRLVRINAARLLAALDGAAPTPAAAGLTALARIATDERGLQLRLAAVRALADIAGGRPARLGLAAAALRTLAADRAAPPELAAAAAAALARAPVAVGRSEWRSFYVVDPATADAPVTQEPYLVLGGDGLAWAGYTDARGELSSEHFPPGEALVWPAHREPEL